MKVGGTASITAITQIITMVLMGFSGTMDGLETNGQHLLGVILSIPPQLFLRPLKNWA
jgi:CPA2 family monovalent cation:H+ antiporter-2